jgi:branched-subunit amino acid ABC-type transport system permease component
MSVVVPAIGFGLITASILALAAVGFTLQFGITNILNLAYADVMTASAFVAYLVTRSGLSVWVGLIVAAVFGAIFSVALNRGIYMRFARRGTRLFGMIIVTIAVSLIISYGLQAIFRAGFFSLPAPSGRSVHFLGMIFTPSQLAIIGIAVAAMAIVTGLLRYTRLGKAMRATAADPGLARNCGINTDRVIDLAWLLSGALCGVAGVTLAINVATFTSATGGTFLIPIVAAAVLGGVGQPYGAMLGALAIGIASEVSAALISPSYKEVVAFVILIVVLLVRPQGIISEVATQKEVVT